MDFAKGEIILVNKPLEWTSFDVVNKLRYALRKKYGPAIKVGHAGTLDPLATGLLIVCTGKMTKQIDSLTGLDKEYTGTFFIGATTPSYDREHEPDAFFDTAHITGQLIYDTAKKFVGEQEQMPPVFSAIKVGGKVAYERARKGKTIELKPRPVNILAFEITGIEMPLVHFKVKCSKGTYIRSLAYDFGKALNSGAYLYGLCRTTVGHLSIDSALSIEDAVKLIDATNT